MTTELPTRLACQSPAAKRGSTNSLSSIGFLLRAIRSSERFEGSWSLKRPNPGTVMEFKLSVNLQSSLTLRHIYNTSIPSSTGPVQGFCCWDGCFTWVALFSLTHTNVVTVNINQQPHRVTFAECTYLKHQSLSFAFQKVFVSSFHTANEPSPPFPAKLLLAFRAETI